MTCTVEECLLPEPKTLIVESDTNNNENQQHRPPDQEDRPQQKKVSTLRQSSIDSLPIGQSAIPAPEISMDREAVTAGSGESKSL